MSEAMALYVHLPWCVAKCPYCDFNSHTLKRDASLSRYVAALQRDLATDASLARGRPIRSLFVGGGTPSVFAPEDIGRVLREASKQLNFAPDIEVTMEANPGALSAAALGGYRAAGVNRLSLGAQSFDARALKRLGRIHGPDDVVSAYLSARRAGFDNINLDLMFGLPGQCTAAALSDIEQAIELAPEHISYYELTLEPNTVFFAAPPADLPGEDTVVQMQSQGLERLAAAGYERYEVSAFAQPGAACRHNLNYWQFGDYLGVGAGAHGKWTDTDGQVWRSSKTAHPMAYQNALESGAPVAKVWRLQAEDKLFEFALNALRLTEGVSEDRFVLSTGLAAKRLQAVAEMAARDGLLEKTQAPGWRPTARGLRFLNDLQARFLPAAAAGVQA